jgi:hypothetical protein
MYLLIENLEEKKGVKEYFNNYFIDNKTKTGKVSLIVKNVIRHI